MDAIKTQIASGKRVLVVHNPRSGQADDAAKLATFCKILEGAGLEVTRRPIAKDVPIREYVQDVADYDVVVAAGGDGTISSLTYAVRYKGVPILIYPTGTANLIAQNLEVPKSPQELAKLVLTGKAVQVDIGEVETGGHKRGFCMLAGAGIDAAMIRDSVEFKDKFGPMAYILGALKQLNPQQHNFELEIDGKKRNFKGIGVMAANFGMANFRLPITDNISPSDGHFTIILMRGGHLFRLIPNIIDSLRARFFFGDPIFDNNLETIEAKSLTVHCQYENLPVQYDGEILQDTTPFSVHILPAAISFLTHLHPHYLDT